VISIPETDARKPKEIVAEVETTLFDLVDDTARWPELGESFPADHANDRG